MAPKVKSAQRTIEILEYFARRKAPATLSEIAGKLGYPPSSTLALLRTLSEMGYLDYAHAERTFVPTVKAALLGIWVNDALMSDGTIARLMYDMREQTGGTPTLGIQSGHYVQYIHVVRGKDALHRPDVAPGALRPLLRSAMGTVLLSLKPPSELWALAGRINAQEPPEHRMSMAELGRRIREYREQGYAYSEGVSTPGAGIITVLLAAPAHQPPMALGIGASIATLRARKLEFLQALQRVVELHRKHMEALPYKFGH
ncbi:DNA-binding transcriptional activator MhpR [Pigmentiphaga humi]|uniref:DNA-binding transcriptional activator MhpR n=1 Tax=Pigmentiphaga humi TaxID=2478468 RepID=A0A3P4AWG4_9BURK|nr:helix-turn-helix domain-containing protein [Pigmentiphaga humi]VCU68387.1 DNA-binding transcriptional activator MhpR [Pigmentiphaga humi]